MHQYTAGICAITLQLTPNGPWMVRGETRRETTVRGSVLEPFMDQKGQPALPGSALKGVIRSTAERILQSIGSARDPLTAPLIAPIFVEHGRDLHGFGRADVSDSELLAWHATLSQEQQAQLPVTPDRIYMLLSAASQLFGATVHAGLLHISDAGVAAATARRSHVALDRFHGGVGEGPFVEELVSTKAPLTTQIEIHNFALWHIALLALVVREINEGYVRFGLGTRKGQGRMQAQMTHMRFEYSALAYQIPSGILSAQARLAAPPWNMADIPQAVLQAESLPVCPELHPREPTCWQEEGIRFIDVPEKQVLPVLQALVAGPWQTWIRTIAAEVPHD